MSDFREMADNGFLKFFCNRDEDSVKEEDEQLSNQLRPQVADEEVEGECIDLCLQYLKISR